MKIVLFQQYLSNKPRWKLFKKEAAFVCNWNFQRFCFGGSFNDDFNTELLSMRGMERNKYALVPEILNFIL